MSDINSTTTDELSDGTIVFVTREGATTSRRAVVVLVEPSHAPKLREHYGDLIVPTAALALARLDGLFRSAGLNRHALPRASQLDEIERLAVDGRRRKSPRELVRFGWCDAPRRPCYRAPRRR
jgi:hypothetical protein